MAALEIVIVVY